MSEIALLILLVIGGWTIAGMADVLTNNLKS